MALTCHFYIHSTCDGHNIHKPPHGTWVDVTKVVILRECVGEIEVGVNHGDRVAPCLIPLLGVSDGET